MDAVYAVFDPRNRIHEQIRSDIKKGAPVNAKPGHDVHSAALHRHRSRPLHGKKINKKEERKRGVKKGKSRRPWIPKPEELIPYLYLPTYHTQRSIPHLRCNHPSGQRPYS